MKVFVYISMLTLTSCAPGCTDYDRILGGGYRFHHTSSIGRFITYQSDIVIDSVIFDYAYNDDYIVAVSLETKNYHCPFFQDNELLGYGNRIEFIDHILYTVIAKKSKKIEVFEDEMSFTSRISQIDLNNKISLDTTERVSVLRYKSNINKELCKQL